jgi:hypothetical protein
MLQQKQIYSSALYSYSPVQIILFRTKKPPPVHPLSHGFSQEKLQEGRLHRS